MLLDASLPSLERKAIHVSTVSPLKLLNDGDFTDANENVLSVYTDTAKKKITLPLTNVITGVPLRMRVITDNPSKEPGVCKLHGTAVEGAGQAEDYSVIILAPQPVALIALK